MSQHDPASQQPASQQDPTSHIPSAHESPATLLSTQSGLPSKKAAAPIAEYMDARLTTIQPGGGIVMSFELFWGRIRRKLLRTFCPGYVAQMRESRQGQQGPIPFDPVDPRDLKFYRNQQTYWWADADDRFCWRESLGFVRVGLAELILIGGMFLVLSVVLGWLWWPLAIPMLTLTGLVAWFFRNPTREASREPGCIVSPADGKLVQIERIEDPELGSCVQYGIFLSIFDVHANRASLAGRVIAVRYRPGKSLNALKPKSARENENLDVILQCPQSPQRYLRIRQITGQFARRIVCWVRPGDVLTHGEMFGMIKLGSRTELIVPNDPNLEIVAKIGDKLFAGTTILGCYRTRIGEDTIG